jgi:predicted dehydrogenase
MKISGAVIQNRNISINTEDHFEATYKGHDIYVSTNHGLGKPKYDHLKRFNIEVHGKDGTLAVDTYDDYHTIEDAIREALIGACLIPNWR